MRGRLCLWDCMGDFTQCIDLILPHYTFGLRQYTTPPLAWCLGFGHALTYGFNTLFELPHTSTMMLGVNIGWPHDRNTHQDRQKHGKLGQQENTTSGINMQNKLKPKRMYLTLYNELLLSLSWGWHIRAISIFIRIAGCHQLQLLISIK